MPYFEITNELGWWKEWLLVKRYTRKIIENPLISDYVSCSWKACSEPCFKNKNVLLVSFSYIARRPHFEMATPRRHWTRIFSRACSSAIRTHQKYEQTHCCWLVVKIRSGNSEHERTSTSARTYGRKYHRTIITTKVSKIDLRLPCTLYLRGGWMSGEKNSDYASVEMTRVCVTQLTAVRRACLSHRWQRKDWQLVGCFVNIYIYVYTCLVTERDPPA